MAGEPAPDPLPSQNKSNSGAAMKDMPMNSQSKLAATGESSGCSSGLASKVKLVMVKIP